MPGTLLTGYCFLGTKHLLLLWFLGESSDLLVWMACVQVAGWILLMFASVVVMSRACGLHKVQLCVAPYVTAQRIAFEEKYWRIHNMILSV